MKICQRINYGNTKPISKLKRTMKMCLNEMWCDYVKDTLYYQGVLNTVTYKEGRCSMDLVVETKYFKISMLQFFSELFAVVLFYNISK